MHIVYKSDKVDLKVAMVESNGKTFYQVYKNDVICKQSQSLDHCLAFTQDLEIDMIKEKLKALEADLYWVGQAYLSSQDNSIQSAIVSNQYTQASIKLAKFKDMLK